MQSKVSDTFTHKTRIRLINLVSDDQWWGRGLITAFAKTSAFNHKVPRQNPGYAETKILTLCNFFLSKLDKVSFLKNKNIFLELRCDEFSQSYSGKSTTLFGFNIQYKEIETIDRPDQVASRPVKIIYFTIVIKKGILLF